MDISRRGKTVVYDTFIQREAVREYDPKSLDEVKGMVYAKNTLYNTVIASFDAERQKEYKDNKISISKEYLKIDTSNILFICAGAFDVLNIESKKIVGFEKIDEVEEINENI